MTNLSESPSIVKILSGCLQDIHKHINELPDSKLQGMKNMWKKKKGTPFKIQVSRILET